MTRKVIKSYILYMEKNRINENIKAPQVVLVKEQSQPDIIDTHFALELAKSQGLDLVEISYDKKNRLPICKIIDYSKYKYELKKKEKEQKQKLKSQIQQVKEIIFSIRIDDNDFNIKVSKIRSFLQDNLKVKIAVQLKRREMNRIDFAKTLINKVVSLVSDIGEVDKYDNSNDKTIICIMKPKNG